MTIAAARVYAEGHRLRHLRLHEPEDRTVQPHQFAWIGLVDPDAAELALLQARFGLHPLAVEDALCEHPLPKVSVYGDQIFVSARTARLEGEEIVYGETCAFLCKNAIITIRRGSARAYTEVRRNLEDAPALLSNGIAYVLYALLDFIVDTYQPIVDDIEEEVLAIERRCLDAFLSREDVTHLFNLRQELIRFRRLLGPMEEVCARLEHLHLPFFDANVRPDLPVRERRMLVKIAFQGAITWDIRKLDIAFLRRVGHARHRKCGDQLQKAHRPTRDY